MNNQQLFVEISLPYPKGTKIVKEIVELNENILSFKMKEDEGYLLPGTPLRNLTIQRNGYKKHIDSAVVIYADRLEEYGEYNISTQFESPMTIPEYPIKETDNGDRREYIRIIRELPIKIKLRDPLKKKMVSVDGNIITLSYTGISFSTYQSLPHSISHIRVEIPLPPPFLPVRSRAKIVWRDKDKLSYGAEFKREELSLLELERFLSTISRTQKIDRRNTTDERRSVIEKTKAADKRDTVFSVNEKRKIYRRITDIWRLESINSFDISEKIRLFKRQKGLGYSHEAVRLQREWVAQETGVELKHIGVFSEDTEKMRGNIENLIGVAQVPIGIAGPLKINGQYAKGVFYVPMATTEGSLVYTYTIGMQILSMSGGANTMILKDELHISPVFSFENLTKSKCFVEWLNNNFNKIKEHAEKVTRHGRLLRIEPYIFDRNVVVKFCYSTGDAMGMNMVTFATDAACKYISPIVKPKRFYLQANFSSIKKVTAHNFVTGYGKSVVGEAVIPQRLIKRIFNITPKRMVKFFNLVLLSTTHAGMIGMNAHVANPLTAIFIACGQDAANVANSHVGVINYETTENGDLYVSLKLPNLLVGTVGGGTDIGTQHECLKLLGCYGSGNALKFSEIVTAAALAGEISLWSSVLNGSFAETFKKYAKKQ
ncbi:MAG: PilZ domain-containing protein [Nitrospirota bacterium]